MSGEFRVEPAAVKVFRDGAYEDAGPGWRVYLPHQCDTWDIAGDEFDGGVPLAEAVAALEKFIADAQVALAKLRRTA